jgi:hypothetical protein
MGGGMPFFVKIKGRSWYRERKFGEDKRSNNLVSI